MTTDLKSMIEGALSDVGGRNYLARQAIEAPGPFLALVGKLLPRDANIQAQITMTLQDALDALGND